MSIIKKVSHRSVGNNQPQRSVLQQCRRVACLAFMCGILSSCSNFEVDLPTQTTGSTPEERLQSVTWRAVSMIDDFYREPPDDPIRYVEDYCFTDTTFRYDRGNIYPINKDGSPREVLYDSIVSFTPTRLEVLRKTTRDLYILFFRWPSSAISHPTRIVFVAEPKGYKLP